MNTFEGWIFFIREYFSGVNISQFKFRIRTDYFGLVCNLFKSFFNRGHRTEVKQFEDWKGAANAVKAVASVPGGLSGDYNYDDDGDDSVSGGLGIGQW